MVCLERDERMARNGMRREKGGTTLLPFGGLSPQLFDLSFFSSFLHMYTCIHKVIVDISVKIYLFCNLSLISSRISSRIIFTEIAKAK